MMLKKCLYIAVVILIPACSHVSARYGTVLDNVKSEFKQSLNPEKPLVINKIPISIAHLLTPKITSFELSEINANNQLERKFNIVADNVTAKSFFLELVDGTPFNVVVHPEVQGNISLVLRNVTVNDVLESVQKIYGYGFEYSPQSVRIFPVSLQTMVFKLNYLDLVRAGNSSTTITGASASFASNNSSNSSSGNSSSTNNNTNNNADSITSKVSTTSNTDLWEQLLKSLQSMIGVGSSKNSEGKAVAINKMAGMIVVTAYPNELQKVEQFLLETERTLNKQVMLEAKIIEVDLNDGYRSGINWALLSDHMNISQIGNKVNNDEVVSSSSTISDSTANTANSSGYDISTGAKHLAPSVPNVLNNFGGLLTLGINYRKLATFVELLSAQGNVQVLSSPRITTSNNQKALIKVGNDQYFITNISTTTTTGTTTSGTNNNNNNNITPSVTLNPFFSGIALDVTPQIGEDDITLHIHPTISTVDPKPTTIPGTVGQVDLAKSTVREADSIVRAKNGQLIVIGGLMQDKTAELIAGIPFLKDIPFLGTVFRHTRQQATKSELVILLRPVILDNYKIKTQLQNSYNRLNDLDRGFHVGGDSKWYGTLGES